MTEKPEVLSYEEAYRLYQSARQALLMTCLSLSEEERSRLYAVEYRAKDAMIAALEAPFASQPGKES